MPADLEKYASQYFTGTQASIWVGDVWVDECFGIQFHATQSIVPIFGYASSRFDAVARGKVLVQGVFEMNFIDEGYLFAILEDADRKRLASDEEAVKRGPADVIKEQIDVLKEVQQVRTSAPTEQATINRSRSQAMGDIINILSNLDIASADKLGRELANNAPIPTENVIYKMIPFRLTGHFGHPEINGKEQGTFKEIVDCFLVSNEMIVGSNDEVVKERYSFIARWHV